jgi:hypothetical protein
MMILLGAILVVFFAISLFLAFWGQSGAPRPRGPVKDPSRFGTADPILSPDVSTVDGPMGQEPAIKAHVVPSWGTPPSPKSPAETGNPADGLIGHSVPLPDGVSNESNLTIRYSLLEEQRAGCYAPGSINRSVREAGAGLPGLMPWLAVGHGNLKTRRGFPARFSFPKRLRIS